MMSFTDSIKTCFSKYVDFSGRATRAELWWFTLFISISYIIIYFIGETLANIFSLAVMLPSLSAAVRRLHDTGRSGWWILLGLIPLLGIFVLFIFYVLSSEEGDNDYGPDPWAEEEEYYEEEDEEAN